MTIIKLIVLGSSSNGNCYLLDDGEHILIIEAGIPFAEVKEAIDYQTSRIAGVLSSHCHQDHRKYLHEYEAVGIPVLKGNIYSDMLQEFIVCEGQRVRMGMGPYIVYPFEVPHDVLCFGYKILYEPFYLAENRQYMYLVFVTDAKYVKYTFPEVNHIMVEANYAQDILDENVSSGEIPESLRKRIMKSHMSFETAKGMVEANKSAELRNVIMCHLSSRNSDKERFQREMEEVAGSWCNVHIATKGLEIPLNKYPF